YEHFLVFDCLKPLTLLSVEVNAESPGNRNIELQDNLGAVIETATINIPSGVSRIDLNFSVPAATDLRLVCTGTPNLFRNNNNYTNYPYVIPGLISINYSSASTNPTGYYYYFYDWEVQEPSCVSQRIPVEATVITCTGAGEIVSGNGYTIYPVPADERINIITELPDNEQIFVSVISADGKTVISSKGAGKITVSTKSLPAGIYFIRISSDILNATDKISIIH
ncbi:MAG: T9SS type A sorting domain-containing protein, partial [Bacteroidota bacterium]